MLKEIFEACWPVLFFLIMALCAKGFHTPTPDEKWEDINKEKESNNNQ